MIKTFLLFMCSDEGHRLPFVRAGKRGEGSNVVGIIWNETRRLDEDAKHFAQFRYVRRRDHSAYGVEVFVGQASACLVDDKTKEGAKGNPTLVLGAFKVQFSFLHRARKSV